MKKLLIILSILVIMLAACNNNRVTPDKGTPGPTAVTTPSPSPEPDKAADYFPLTENIHMQYKGTGNEYAQYETWVDYIKDDKIQIRESNGGTVSVNVYRLEDGALRKVYTQAEVYYLHDFTNLVNTDEIIIKEPIQVGTSWTLTDGTVRNITAIDKEVETPSGKYTALEVTTTWADSITKDYFVKGIGLIKNEFVSTDSTMTVTSELEKTENNVPMKQSVGFYYPEFEKDRVVYISRTIETNTNDNVIEKIEQGLRTIPENSGLAPVLSANAKVLGYYLDESAGILTVDFSSQLVTEMNAGSGFEGMLIKSIVNTFGSYFQKEKVIITLEGKPYESGHIVMKTGEFFKVETGDTVEYK